MNLLSEFKYQTYEREYITKYNKSIKNQLKIIAYSTCSDEISQSHIDTSINNYDYGYIYRDTTDNNRIVGFILWSIRNQPYTLQDEIYIRILCGRGLGELLFNDIEDVAHKNKINTIILIPVNDKIQNHYILKYGFKLRGYDKKLKGIVLYKNINMNNIIKLNMKNKTTKYNYSMKKNNMKKRRTYKLRRKNINNINEFIEYSKSKKIMNLSHLNN